MTSSRASLMFVLWTLRRLRDKDSVPSVVHDDSLRMFMLFLCSQSRSILTVCCVSLFVFLVVIYSHTHTFFNCPRFNQLRFACHSFPIYQLRGTFLEAASSKSTVIRLATDSLPRSSTATMGNTYFFRHDAEVASQYFYLYWQRNINRFQRGSTHLGSVGSSNQWHHMRTWGYAGPVHK